MDTTGYEWTWQDMSGFNKICWSCQFQLKSTSVPYDVVVETYNGTLQLGLSLAWLLALNENIVFKNTQLYKNLYNSVIPLEKRDISPATRLYYIQKQKKAITKLNFNDKNILCEFSKKLLISKRVTRFFCNRWIILNL